MKICKNITCKIFPFDQKWPARMVTVKVANSEVIEFLFKLERTDRSLKVFHPVFRHQKFSNFTSNFPTSFFSISFRTFQFLGFYNFSFFPTALSNYMYHGLRSRVTNNLDPILMVMMKLQQS